MIKKIIGNTTATPVPRSDWEQADASKADYIKNKPNLDDVLRYSNQELTEEQKEQVRQNIGVTGEIGVSGIDWVAKKTESGGDTVVVSEQTVNSDIWSKRQLDIIPGTTYDVYINGIRYACIAMNNYGGISLGNHSLSGNSTLSHNNEPFCLYWAGGSDTWGVFFKDVTLNYPLILKVTDNMIVEYDKMPPEYLPDGVAMKTDILDVSGIVKSVNGTKPDANGNINIPVGNGGLHIEDDGNGNVIITSFGGVSITDDGNGNVIIA